MRSCKFGCGCRRNQFCSLEDAGTSFTRWLRCRDPVTNLISCRWRYWSMDNAESYWTEGGKHSWMATFCIRVTIPLSPSFIPQSSVCIFDELGTRKRSPSLLHKTGCRLGSKTRTIATPKKEDPTSKPAQRGLFIWIMTVVVSVRIPAPFTDLKDSQVNSERTHRHWQCVTKSAERNRAQKFTTLSGLADLEPSDDATKMYPAKTAVTKEFHDPGEGNKSGYLLGTHPSHLNHVYSPQFMIQIPTCHKF